MNVFRNPFLLVVLFCSFFVLNASTGCKKGETEESLVAKVAKAWKVSALTVDGNAITTGTDGFTLTLNQNGDKPTTYSITTGGLPYSFATQPSGIWTLLPSNENPTSIVFDNFTAQLVSISLEQLVIRYNETAPVGKPQPVVQFTLVPR